MLLSAFTGCGGTTPTPSAGTTEEETTEADTTPVYRNLFQNGTSPYVLIHPYSPTQDVFDATIYLQECIEELTGTELAYKDDFYNPFKETLPETAFEILIGETNRPETAEAKALIRDKDFIIYEKNNRIAIVGGSDDKTVEGVLYFIENYFDLVKRNITILEGMQDISRYSYDLGVISIDGVELSNYTVVIPKNPDTLFPYFAALNFIDYIKTEEGTVLTLAYDTEKEQSDYEIVIGETTRPESQSAKKTVLQDSQYILKKVGSSIYMYGQDYMVGGALSDFVNNYIVGANDTTTNKVEVEGLPTSNIAKTFTFPKEATSALLLIGDGMGLNHVETTFADRSDSFLAEYLDNVGLCTTFPYGGSAVSTGYTDSAASATALATGYKTKNNYLGKDHNANDLQNVRELASSVGAKTAVLTTDAITGATPAGFLCHHTSRKATAELQQQINQLRRKDKNLLFATSVVDNKPKLLDETRNILYTLADEGDTYFAMIEEAYIDKESHNNNMKTAKNCVLRYNDVIGYCIQFVMLHPETALIITADHECGGLYIEGNKVYYTSTNHTNAKVPVYAIGPETEMFRGKTVDNTDIGKLLGSIYTDAPFGDQ